MKSLIEKTSDKLVCKAGDSEIASLGAEATVADEAKCAESCIAMNPWGIATDD